MADVAVHGRMVDGRPFVLGTGSLVKRQPDDNMGVEENHVSSPVQVLNLFEALAKSRSRLLSGA